MSSSAQTQKVDNRQSRSCRVCRIRKVKCDRVKPCQACCAHGHPSQCVYDPGPSGDQFQPISQEEEIARLRNEIQELRARLGRQAPTADTALGERAVGGAKLVELERLFDTLRSGPPDAVASLVDSIRANRPSLQPYDDLEGETDDDALPAASNNRSLVRPRLPLRGPRNGAEKQHHSHEWELQARRLSSTLQQQHRGLTRRRYSRSSSGSNDSSDSGSSVSSRSSTITVPSDDEQCGPLSRFVSNKPMLDVFIQRFVDAFSPEVDTSSGRAGALRAGAGIRMFSPLLSSAYEAVSLTFSGRMMNEPRIESAGMKLYPRVLRSLQDALFDPERSRAEATLITVVLLLAFESIERTSQTGVTAHVRGATQLIRHRGPESHMYGVEHLLFTELRPYWVFSGLVDRKAFFMNAEAWKTIPWSAGTSRKDYLHYLLDIAVEIPELLGEHDDLKRARQFQSIDQSELSSRQMKLWGRIAEITARLEKWKRDYIDNHPKGPPKPDPTAFQGAGPFPVFRCRDLRTMAIIEQPPLVYADLLQLQGVCVYMTTRLILSTADDRPEGAVTRAEKYQFACYIARSLECYLRRSPGNMINRLAFPVRVAWEAFPPVGPEREFMMQVFHYVEQKHGLRLWGSGLPELTVRARPAPTAEQAA